MKEKKEIRPREYTHIDYEALLVYVMKNQLTTINNVIEACNGNWHEATIVINSEHTPLGNIKISRQGLSKIMKNYGLVKEKYEEHMRDKKDNSEREK